MTESADDGELSCPACGECGMFTLATEAGRTLARCVNCGDAIEIAVVKCCEFHGRNCEPEEPCCRWCTEVRHASWTDERGVRMHGHPVGEKCAVRP